MSNSSLICYTKLSPNYTSGRKYPITKITPHHMAGNLSVETCGNVFASSSRAASSNYGIGSDGRIGMYVEECKRAWTSSNSDNDNRAVTIEVANSATTSDWPISDAAWDSLVELCVDICERNGIESLEWTGDATGTLTCHYFFAATSCPGPTLKGRMAELAETVNARLNGTSTTTSTTTSTSTSTSASTGTSTSTSSSSSSTGYTATLDVDGYWGPKTTKRLQTVLGTTVDGVVSSQNKYWKSQNPGLTDGWEWVSNPSGSLVIIAMQKKLGNVDVDGLIGPETITALQKRYGTVQDGCCSSPSSVVMALQKKLNSGTF